jgi:streptogramin lyase
MRLEIILFSSLFIQCSYQLLSQENLAIGQWRSHLPFNNGISVTQNNTHIFFGTEYAVLSFDKNDRSMQRISKVEGLSKVGVNFVSASRGSGILMVAYLDGTIDLISGKKVKTLIDVPFSNIIPGNKKINKATHANDSIAFLSANYGISALNLKTGLFPNTIRTPIEVRDFQIYLNRYYASTREGIYYFDTSSGLNVNDFSNWMELDASFGLPDYYSSKVMSLYNGKLYFDVSDSIYVFDGNRATYLHHFQNFNLQFLSADGKNLLAGYRCPGDCNGNVFLIDATNRVIQAPANCVNRPRYAIEDSQESIWFADDFNFYRIQTKGSNTCELVQINSPYSININQITTYKNDVWIASGGLNQQYSALFRGDGFFSFIDGKWSVYNLWNRPELGADPVTDFISIQVDPKTGKVYTGAFLDALVVYDPKTKEMKVYRENNSTLQVAAGDPTRTRVAGIAFDSDGALWVANNRAPKPLSVLRPDGSWQSFDIPCTPANGLLQIAVDNLGYKWITTDNSSTGLIIFDEGDLANNADNRCKVINTSNSVLPTNEINTVEVDRNGAVWVGTKSGAVVFYCNPLDQNCTGTRPFIEVDGFGANLLEDQDVRCIGIDGGNRKWFGTGTGLFVMSPEGNKQIAHFNANNSPLLDNNIVDIAFIQESGEVFIGTLKGLISYRAEATASKDYHSGSVTVFPNPVRPDYDGPIAIKGLATDAIIKITDVKGQLVFETEALGGQAIWNGRDYNGRKASSGVYLIFATSRNFDRPDVEVAKVLIVR